MKGLTLVEVLLAVVISLAVAGLLLVVIINSAGIYYKQSSKLTEGLNINDSLLNIRNSIKDAKAVVANYTGDSQTYTSGPTTLVLKLSSIDSSNNIIADKFDYFVFYLDQNKLRLRTFPDNFSSRKAQNRIFSTLVDNLVFKYFNSAALAQEVVPANATKVQVTLTLSQKNGQDIEKNTAFSEANLRND